MKSDRTKAQEVVNILFGYGNYIVKDEDVSRLAEHLDKVLSDLLDPKYASALVGYASGEDVTPMLNQLKFHAINNARVAVKMHPEAKPTFLGSPDMDKESWSLAELGEVLYGVIGDSKVYNLGLSSPVDGKTYTREEVNSILERLNNGSRKEDRGLYPATFGDL